MRFQQQRHPLDRGRVGALSALGQALLDQRGGICKPRDRRQVAHSPQKSSLSRSQLAACANMRASVNFPTPRGPANSMACGTRSLRQHAAQRRHDPSIAEKFARRAFAKRDVPLRS